MTRRPTATRGAVVVPAGHGGSSLACLRSLGRRGIRTIGVASDAGAGALRSRYCDEAVVLPSPSDDLDAYADGLLELAARPEVVTVVPLYEPDAYVLAARRDEFAAHVATPWPTLDVVERAQDRLQLLDAAEAAGVPTPESGLLDDWDRWDRRTVVKPRYTMRVEDGRAAYGSVHFPEPGVEPDRERLVAEMGHVPLVQEYVPGDAEHGFFALCEGGVPVATFQHRRVRSYTYAGGASVYRRSVRNDQLQALGTALLAELDWDGPAMVEVKRDPRDGRFRLVEVNPRFWGSLPLAVQAGVDFPHAYYRLATGEPTGPPPRYEVGVGCHVLRGEASYLHSLLRYDYPHVDRPSLGAALLAIGASLLTQPHFDYLSADDPWPFVRDLVDATARTARSA